MSDLLTLGAQNAERPERSPRHAFIDEHRSAARELKLIGDGAVEQRADKPLTPTQESQIYAND